VLGIHVTYATPNFTIVMKLDHFLTIFNNEISRDVRKRTETFGDIHVKPIFTIVMKVDHLVFNGEVSGDVRRRKTFAHVRRRKWNWTVR